MSMSEFERQLNDLWDKDSISLSTHNQDLPADFNEEDIAFAQELDTLFSMHEEEIPPYFVQTLLEYEDPRFQPIEHGFEHKTRARVFRRLKLRRRLFQLGRPSFSSLIGGMPVRRSLAAGAMVMLFVFLTVMLTGTSFASGMEILLRGARVGVLQVHSYPMGVHSAPFAPTERGDADPLPTVSLREAEQQLHDWKMYWPHVLPDNYTLSATYLYQEQQQSWADGPFMELDFSLAAAHGTGILAIREFKLKPNVNVLQVVKDGAAQSIKIDQNGQAQAIYVDGQWMMRSKFLPVWVYGQRSELIYQRDGIVFWIVGDQRDGINENELLTIANSLQVFRVGRYMHMGNDATAGTVTLLDGDINSPFTGDVLAVYPDGSDLGPYLTLIGSQQPAPDKPASTTSHSR